MAFICRFLLACLGWKVKVQESLYSLPQYVLIVAPHTSNWDFPLGILVRCAYRLGKVRFLAKASLFVPPFGWIFRALGGYPVDRSKPNRLVDNYVEVFKSKPNFAIVIAPEGTRKKVERFKTGFYYIAKGANIPIIMCRFDYSNRVVDFSEPLIPGNDAASDIRYIEGYFRGIRGRNPQWSF